MLKRVIGEEIDGGVSWGRFVEDAYVKAGWSSSYRPLYNLQVIVFWYLCSTVVVFVMVLCFKWLHVTEMKRGRSHICVHVHITYHKQFCW